MRGGTRLGDDGGGSVEKEAGNRRQQGHRDDGAERDVAGGGDDRDEDRETDEDGERHERQKRPNGRGDALSAAEAVEERRDVAEDGRETGGRGPARIGGDQTDEEDRRGPFRDVEAG